MTQFVFASMEGAIYRFRRLAWLEWLQYLIRGGDKKDINKYGDLVGINEDEMMNWVTDDAQHHLDQALGKLKKTTSK